MHGLSTNPEEYFKEFIHNECSRDNTQKLVKNMQIFPPHLMQLPSKKKKSGTFPCFQHEPQVFLGRENHVIIRVTDEFLPLMRIEMQAGFRVWSSLTGVPATRPTYVSRRCGDKSLSISISYRGQTQSLPPFLCIFKICAWGIWSTIDGPEQPLYGPCSIRNVHVGSQKLDEVTRRLNVSLAVDACGPDRSKWKMVDLCSWRRGWRWVQEGWGLGLSGRHQYRGWGHFRFPGMEVLLQLTNDSSGSSNLTESYQWMATIALKSNVIVNF